MLFNMYKREYVRGLIHKWLIRSGCRLESVLSQSWQRMREALVSKVAADLAQREAALAARERAADEATTCSLCMDHPKGVVFGCGHQTCAECSAAHSDCPFCREPISSRITLFQT